MNDLIDRKAAIVQACKQIKDDYIAFDVKEALKAIPAAEPKCKTCAVQRGCRFGQYLGNDGYCSNWERRTDD